MIRAAVLGTTLAVLAVGPVLACSCLPPTPTHAHAAADLVVLGRITAAGGRPTGPWQATVAVRRAWKAPAEATIRVATGGMCGTVLSAGTDRLLFLRREEGAWVTGLCSGNQAAEEAVPFLRWLDANAMRTR